MLRQTPKTPLELVHLWSGVPFFWLLFFGIKKSNQKPGRKYEGEVTKFKRLLSFGVMQD